MAATPHIHMPAITPLKRVLFNEVILKDGISGHQKVV